MGPESAMVYLRDLVESMRVKLAARLAPAPAPPAAAPTGAW
jgi:hypothetical protein